jgi:hypothetical protein
MAVPTEIHQTVRADTVVYAGTRHHTELEPASTFVAPPHPWGALVTACLALFLIAVNTTAITTAVRRARAAGDRRRHPDAGDDGEVEDSDQGDRVDERSDRG